MTTLGDWLEPHPHGIYVRSADACIDPSIPSPRALVTHGHAYRARGGHGAVWVTHGREDALVHWCATHQIKARALALVGFEDEDD